MDREWRNYLQRERARGEREARERAEAFRSECEQAERDRYGPPLLALNPIKLVFTFRKAPSGVRAEAVGLQLSYETRTEEDARRGLMKMIKERARLFPRQVLEAAQLDARAECVTIDLEQKTPAKPARSRRRSAPGLGP
jgi:hypothetical protein